MMTDTPYTYDYEKCQESYISRTLDPTRQEFAIMSDGELVGLISLKRIDKEKKQAEFGIALTDDLVKGKGYGTQAIALLVDHAENTLGLRTILANSVHRNTRSQHILIKVGFVYTHEDANFKFYELTL
jgi:RimJ/RimL family protein N-acetyltransferase